MDENVKYSIETKRFFLSQYIKEYCNYREKLKLCKTASDFFHNNIEFCVTPTIVEEVKNHFNNAENSTNKNDTKLYNEGTLRGVFKRINFIDTNNNEFLQKRDLLSHELINNNIMKNDTNSLGKTGDSNIVAEGILLGIPPLTLNEQHFVVDKGISSENNFNTIRRDKIKQYCKENGYDIYEDCYPYSVTEYNSNLINIKSKQNVNKNLVKQDNDNLKKKGELPKAYDIRFKDILDIKNNEREL